MKKTKRINNIVLLVQLLLSILTLFLVYRFGVLEPLQFIVVSAVVALLYLITFSILKGTKKVKSGRLLSLLLSILLFISSFFVYRTDLFLRVISNGKTTTNTISFVALKDSGYHKLADVQNHDFGFNESSNRAYVEEALTKANKKNGNKFSAIPENNDQILVDNLYDGSYEVIMIHEAQRGFINEYHENFDDSTIVLHQEHFIEKLESSKGPVNITQDTFSFFISGIDTYGPVSSVSRSDVNMILTLDPVNKQILLTGIPRDYYVELPSFGAKDKLTHAGVYGIDESISTLEKLLGVHIDYFARVNFNSVETIVDALGGVTVESRYNFSVDGYDFVKGPNRMNGKMALRFVRERKTLPDGDTDRVKNQAALMAGLIKESLSPATLANYGSILSSVSDSLQLSMPEKEMKAFIRSQISNPSSWDITNYVLKGTGKHSTNTYSMPGWNLYVMEPNLESVACGTKLIEALENHELIPTDEEGIRSFCQ